MLSRTSRRGARALLAAGCVTALTAGTAVLAAPAVASERVTLVVVLQGTSNAGSVGQEMARRHGGQLGFVYQHALKGFSISVPERAAQAIARDSRVRTVERDQVLSTQAQEVPTGLRRIYAVPTPSTAGSTTTVGNTALGIDGVDDRRVDVDIAVIDTGIAPHPDLNIVAATNCSGGSPLRGACKDGSPTDGNGHGTHVAGTAAALDNGVGVVGVAPGARLHAVKVLSDSGSGYTSWIVAGIDWVTAHNTDSTPSNDIEVANMSLGGSGTSDAQATAIAGSVAAGTTYAVAAGNSSSDAQGFTPANVADVITVSAIADFDGLAGGAGAPGCRPDVDDTLADYSNWGTTVEIAAPGTCITSTWLSGGYNTISGTSMASPHVAGAAAVLAATPRADGKRWTPAQIVEVLRSKGNAGWVDDAFSKDGVHEPLLDIRDSEVFRPALVPTGGAQEPSNPPAGNAAPTASFTHSCSKLTCSFDGTGSNDPEDGGKLTYAWDFGDGKTSTEARPTNTYATHGTYTVTLTVTDTAGASGSTSKSIRVKR